MSNASVAALVSRAADGDQAAWVDLVDRYSGRLWSIALSYRLSAHHAADVVQTAWLRLVPHIGDLHEPDSIGAWLATTTRREALRVIAANGREEPRGDEYAWDHADPAAADLDARLLRHEQRVRVRAALAQLPSQQRVLLEVLSAQPDVSYREVSVATGMPIGSIGPMRARALRRMQVLLSGDDFANTAVAVLSVAAPA